MVDILQLVEQFRAFLEDESDTFFGLVFFVVAEAIAIGYILATYFEQFKGLTPLLFGAAAALTIVIWAFHRHITMPKKEFTITLANFNVIALNIKNGIGGQEKRALEEEILEYIENAIHGHKNKLEFDRYIRIVRLPRRIHVTQRNAQSITNRLKTNILISGTLKYQSPTEVYIDPKFHFSIEPKESFYEKFKQRLTEVDTFKIDLTQEFAQGSNSPFATMVHYLVYVALLFEGIRNSNKHFFEDAHKIFTKATINIQRVHNPTRTLLDLHLALQFYTGKNLHQWGKWLAKHKDNEQALKKYSDAVTAFFEQHPHMPTDENKLFLEHSYLYAIHLLIKEGKLGEAKKRLENVKKKLKDNPELLKEQIELLSQQNKRKTEQFIKSITNEDPRVYEQIGEFYYNNKEYVQAQEYLEKKLAVQSHQIYEPALFDIEDHMKLMDIHLHNLSLIQAQKEGLIIAFNKLKNAQIKKL